MATRSSHDGDGEVSLPGVVGVELNHLSRLSWELGTRVVGDDRSQRHSEWEHASAAWALSIFRVTSDTVLLRLRTPVGRERFYGATRRELESSLDELAESASWTERTT